MIPSPKSPTPEALLPEVTELSLLLPSWQVQALEAEAQQRGLTTAQMMRRVLGDFLGRCMDASEARRPRENVVVALW